MIDIKLIRENPEMVKENIKKKFQDHKLILVDEVLELDKKNREAKLNGDNQLTLITCVENEPEYRRCVQALEREGIVE